MARAANATRAGGDGAQVRDLLFVDDLVDALVLAVENVDRIEGRAFNIGGGPENTASLLEVVELIAELCGEQPEISFAPERIGDQRYYVSDTTRFEDETGWAQRVGVEGGIETLHQWLERRTQRALEATAR